MLQLKQVRHNLGITQQDVSEILDIPLRTIESWETNVRKTSEWVHKLVIHRLESYETGPLGIITERKGVYAIEQIKEKILSITLKYNIKKIILFGSYAKRVAQVTSDIDVLIDTDIGGINFFTLLDDVKKLFIKRVDLIRLKDVKKDSQFYSNIMKDGITLYDAEL